MDFKASNGWLHRFKSRHNITQGAISGESGDVSADTVKEFQEKLPDLVRGYKASDIFNMDESGLFYRALPKKTLKSAGDKCSGGKQSKERLTASFCVSMEGEFEQTVMIGK